MPRFSDLLKEERRQKSIKEKETAQIPQAESTEKVVTFLYQHQLRWIDQIARECKAKGGKHLWRGEVIRGLLDGIIGQNINLLGIEDEFELAQRVRELFASGL